MVSLSEWIRGQHGSCPTCRQIFLNVRPLTESDEESSDGGEYIPSEDFDGDEDDGFVDTDIFTDADADYSEYDTDFDHDDSWDDDAWTVDDSRLGLDGERHSDSVSDSAEYHYRELNFSERLSETESISEGEAHV
ncbi:hypothetical protein AX17_001385 [Amanita inopinata Kibby_2008]|nr:hypothetical protein AX17_001385 [Amanita inopinata Kibby_2008]